MQIFWFDEYGMPSHNNFVEQTSLAGNSELFKIYSQLPIAYGLAVW